MVGLATLRVKGKPPVESVGGMVTTTPTVEPDLLGVTDAGLNKHCAPAGRLPQLRLTASLNAPVAVSVTCAVADPPGSAIKDAGVALIVNPLPAVSAEAWVNKTLGSAPALQTMFTLPAESTAIWGLPDPGLRDTF